jgi:5'-3' exonuclease
MELTREQFVDLAILCGCDFSSTLPDVSPFQAYQLIRRWGSIEKIMEIQKIVRPKFFTFEVARKIYLNHESKQTPLQIRKIPDRSEAGLKATLATILASNNLVDDENYVISTEIDFKEQNWSPIRSFTR